MTNSPDVNESADRRETVPPRADDLRTLLIGGPKDPSISRDEWDSPTQGASEATWVESDAEPIERDEEPWQHSEPSRRQTSTQEAYDTRGAVRDESDSYIPSSDTATTQSRPVEETFAKHPSGVAEFGTPAGFGRRLVAFIIDSIIVIIALALILPVALNRPLIDIDGLNEYFDYVGELMQEAANEPDSPTSASDEPPLPERAADALANLQFASFINAILFCLYQAILIGITGTTPGKKLLSIYILDRNGKIMGMPRSFARSIPMFASILFFYFGFIFALFRSDNRTLHDLIADTYPVKARTSDESSIR